MRIVAYALYIIATLLFVWASIDYLGNSEVVELNLTAFTPYIPCFLAYFLGWLFSFADGLSGVDLPFIVLAMTIAGAVICFLLGVFQETHKSELFASAASFLSFAIGLYSGMQVKPTEED